MSKWFNGLGSGHAFESENLLNGQADLQGDYDDFSSGDSNYKYTMIATVVLAWVLAIIGMAIGCFVCVPKNKKSTDLWEFLAFGHMYFNTGGLIALFVPQKIESTEGLNWLGNGGLGGGISLVLTSLFCAIYAKFVKVKYGNNPNGGACSSIRMALLAIVMLAGFAAGGAIIYVATYRTPKDGKWLLAAGVVAAIYLLFALPVVAIAVALFGINTYPVEEEKGSKSLEVKESPLKSKPGSSGGNSKRGSSGGHSKTGSSDDHVKSIAERGQKTVVRPLRRTASQQSTGSTYYKNLMESGGSQVKSISQYGALGGGGSGGHTTGPPPPPPPPQSPVKRTSSQQSTGSGYYAQLMQTGDTHQVKSISQYGALLGGGPK